MLIARVTSGAQDILLHCFRVIVDHANKLPYGKVLKVRIFHPFLLDVGRGKFNEARDLVSNYVLGITCLFFSIHSEK